MGKWWILPSFATVLVGRQLFLCRWSYKYLGLGPKSPRFLLSFGFESVRILKVLRFCELIWGAGATGSRWSINVHDLPVLGYEYLLFPVRKVWFAGWFSLSMLRVHKCAHQGTLRWINSSFSTPRRRRTLCRFLWCHRPAEGFGLSATAVSTAGVAVEVFAELGSDFAVVNPDFAEKKGWWFMKLGTPRWLGCILS